MKTSPFSKLFYLPKYCFILQDAYNRFSFRILIPLVHYEFNLFLLKRPVYVILCDIPLKVRRTCHR